jgi:methenyltetrahydromethanopterin cyclohydrolase
MKKKRPSDVNVMAFQIVQEATQDKPALSESTKEKHPAAVALGRLGGLKGGPARAKKLSKKRRKEIAQRAAKSRWKK